MNLFDAGADYASFRPSYPPELPGLLAQLPAATTAALDVGCGTGQLTATLAPHFDTVLGVDPSESQIANATGPSNVAFQIGAAELLPNEDESVDLITVAQAAHWIDDLPAFYDEARRVGAQGSALALISYGVCHVEGLDEMYQKFYWGDFHRHWKPARYHVDTALAHLDFPFEAIPVSCPDITRELTFAEFVAYLGTWSAMKSPGAQEEFADFQDKLATAWGDASMSRQVRWPVTVRAGRLKTA